MRTHTSLNITCTLNEEDVNELIKSGIIKKDGVVIEIPKPERRCIDAEE